jgi:UDP-N-acetylmuramoylalanine--D-glutamate ligase
MELFFKFCDSKIFAVTGSDGKTTTTTLIYKMLCKEGYTCHLGGNIGRPLLPDLECISKDDFVVLELSSFQLQTFKKSPQVCVITNITPNHLDWHTSYEEYILAKKNIFLNQAASDRMVINFDYDTTASFEKEKKGEVFGFSYKKDLKNGVFFKEGTIFLAKNGKEEPILKRSDILLLGEHNTENYMAAIAATDGFVSKNSILAVAKTFKGVPHRIEIVREFEGVKYINSSIDSSPNRTAATLKVFDKKVILIAGGKKKGIPFDLLGQPLCEKVKILILIGETASEIEASLSNANKNLERPIIFHCNTYDEVIKTARENATDGDVVLLSPASTSFDRFKNFEERGETFKRLVSELK